MSTRLFKAMAEGIKKSTIGIDGIARVLLVQNVCVELAMVYPRFDTAKFTAACEPEPSPITLDGLYEWSTGTSLR